MSEQSQGDTSFPTKDSHSTIKYLDNDYLFPGEAGQTAHEGHKILTTPDIPEDKCKSAKGVTTMKDVTEDDSKDGLNMETSKDNRREQCDQGEKVTVEGVDHQGNGTDDYVTSPLLHESDRDDVERGIINISKQKVKTKAHPKTCSHTSRQEECPHRSQTDRLSSNAKLRQTCKNEGQVETRQSFRHNDNVRAFIKQTPVRKSHSTGELRRSGSCPRDDGSDPSRKTQVNSDTVVLPLITNNVTEYSFDHPRGYRRVDSLAPALESKPPSYMWLALFTIFFNFIIGLIALVIASKSTHIADWFPPLCTHVKYYDVWFI